MLDHKGISEPQKLAPTPVQILGPYYPVERDPNADSDLTLQPGASGRAKGATLHVEGRVFFRDGQLATGALVEAWQCDHAGVYRHPDALDGDTVDPNFEGYGRCVTDGAGSYAFKALRPVSYPGRAPHLHIMVRLSGEPVLITQMYLDGELENDTDFALWRAGDLEEQRRLIADVSPSTRGDVDFEARFNLVLNLDGPV